jgi:hypothetical protein
MSTLAVNTVTDANGGNTATINSMTPTADSLQGFRNRIINGDMRIDQRNAGASVTVTNTAANTYTLDRWSGYGSQASKFSVQQDAGAVTPPVGFTNYLGATSLSAYSVGSSETFVIQQYIEGFNTADLGWGTANAKTVTLSFWVRSSLTGTFGGALRNSAFNRSYPFSYTISSANTWEYKTVTVAGDTSGTWLTNNGIGIRLVFSLGTGSALSGTAGAWAGSSLLSATGATSVVGTNGATWYVTGVQLEVGGVATPFERRPYGQELSLCQRYYARITSGTGSSTVKTAFGVGLAVATNSANLLVLAPVTMRAFPTFNYSSVDFTDSTNYDAAVSAITEATYSNNGVRIKVTTANTMTQYRPGSLVANYASASAGYVEFSAEV